MLAVIPVEAMPEVAPGDDVAALIVGTGVDLRDGDVLVVSQKIVSKAEGALVHVPHDEDLASARRRVARSEAASVLVDGDQALIVRTRHGFVCANAGVDASNLPARTLALLPADPDASARAIRSGVREAAGVDVGVIVSDTFGRAWRVGQTEVAIGVAGVAALRDERGGTDRSGMALEVTLVALADEIAAAADLVRRKAGGVPVVVVRGLPPEDAEAASARQLVRPPEDDLFIRGRGALAQALARGGLQHGEATAMLTSAALGQVLAAARGLGGPLVTLERRPGALRVHAPDDAAAGAAAAAAVAALADLGIAAGLAGPPASGATIDIVVGPGGPGGPPEPGATSGR